MIYQSKRSYEIKSPGQTQRDISKEVKRKEARREINFFCRYVLAKQQKSIPFK